MKDLRRYIAVVLLLTVVGLNSYGINKNTAHANSNARATISLSGGVIILADSFSYFIKNYIKTRDSSNSGMKELAHRELENHVNIARNKGSIKSNKITAMINKAFIIHNEIEIENINKKPSYKYLKSVTVFVEGLQLVFKTEDTPFDVKRWSGTGVVVKIDNKNTYILTNKHVAGGYRDGHKEIYIATANRKYTCEIVKLHKSQDLALLKINAVLKGKEVVKGYNTPAITEQVFTVGHSLARPFMYGEGIFAGTTIEHDVYQLPTIGGQSGSGVFNKNGELLGLLYSISGTRNGFGVQWDFTRGNVVKSVYVREFLEENL